MKRGEIFLADLGTGKGSEQTGLRPCVIIQNDIGNKYSTTVIICAITSQITKKRMPTHVELNGFKTGLEKDSVALLEQIRTIDKSRLVKKVSSLDDITMKKIENAMLISLGIGETISLITA